MYLKLCNQKPHKIKTYIYIYIYIYIYVCVCVCVLMSKILQGQEKEE